MAVPIAVQPFFIYASFGKGGYYPPSGNGTLGHTSSLALSIGIVAPAHIHA